MPRQKFHRDRVSASVRSPEDYLRRMLLTFLLSRCSASLFPPFRDSILSQQGPLALSHSLLHRRNAEPDNIYH